jgi:23S rRNA (guanine2445-N2)-methyltransferase / 23S rRNA (guanine2069-N7)-methyltransferase
LKQAFFAPVARGLEAALVDELCALGLQQVRGQAAGVAFVGSLADAYRACLWSRIASRVLLPIHRFAADSDEALYEGVQAVAWDEHLAPDGSLAVEFTSSRSQLDHSQFGAQRVKDAVVDQLRDKHGVRPSVARDRPQVRIHCHVSNNRATLSIDLAGEALHRRGYRTEQRAAPLKENLAAGILRLAGWHQPERRGEAFLDPMCGSGTFLIEAAWMALNCAPGLQRDYFGFLGWRGHQANVWATMLQEAHAQAATPTEIPRIVGYDADSNAVRAALANLEAAGLRGKVHAERRDVAAVTVPATTGCMVVNPPYGERLGDETQLVFLYQQLGNLMQEAPSWRCGVFTGSPVLMRRGRRRPAKTYALFNGSLACELQVFEGVATSEPVRESVIAAVEPSAGAQAFANRLEKNLKHLRRWAKREGVTCYRIYDADIPEYAVAVDLYQDHVHVQEYAPPKHIDETKAIERMHDVIATLPSVLGVPPSHIHCKVRRRQKGNQQYERMAEKGNFISISEQGAKFWVNLTDYLDTGLFLDHRPTRQWIQQVAMGKRFLNLFCYTASVTVAAALGGAQSSVSVDLSNTYLDWAERNFALNGIYAGNHELIHADCMAWLKAERRMFDLIFVDPPTFSNSKRMDDVFDVQRDHVALLTAAMRRLAPEGVLVFSNNFRKFVLAEEDLAEFVVEDISSRTIPPDFERNAKIHRCWQLRHRQSV